MYNAYSARQSGNQAYNLSSAITWRISEYISLRLCLAKVPTNVPRPIGILITRCALRTPRGPWPVARVSRPFDNAPRVRVVRN